MRGLVMAGALCCALAPAAWAPSAWSKTSGPILFEKARLGMSLTETRRAAPDAQLVKGGAREFDEQHRLLTHRRLHGVRMHVQFWYGSHGLARVVETSEGLDPAKPLSGDTVRAISRYLARRFGEPAACRLRQPSGDIASCRFVRSGVTAVLSASPEDGPPRLKLVFRAARVDDDAGDQ